MDLTLLLMVVCAAGVLVIGWRQWPAKLELAHEMFRNRGETPIYRRGRLTGRLIPTGITVKASDFQFPDRATFVLIPPMMHSRGVANVNGGQAEWRVKAVTRYPTMQSYFIAD